jgi:hypothetical protein
MREEGGVMEFTRIGVLEYWSSGVMEYWRWRIARRPSVELRCAAPIRNRGQVGRPAHNVGLMADGGKIDAI